MYSLLWDELALQDLQQLSSAEARRIVKKVTTHLMKDPVGLGKPLRGKLGGLYRYRIGDYRVVYEIRQKHVQIIVVKVGHRKDVYDG